MSVSLSQSSSTAIRSRSVSALEFGDTSSSADEDLIQIESTTATTQSDDIGLERLVDFVRFDQMPETEIMDEIGHILDHCIASGDPEPETASNEYAE